MQDRIRDAFDSIHASDAVKQRTMEKLSERVNERKVKKSAYLRPLVSAAACLVLVIFGTWLYFTPTAQISVDINPSIELSVNRFDRVLSVESYNDDGVKLAETLDLRFSDCTSALEQILENEKIAELLSHDEVLTFTVVGLANGQRNRLLNVLESETINRENAYCYAADAAEVSEAHEAGLSYGKYRAFLELKALAPDMTPEDVQNMTMREIRDLIALYSDDDETTPPGKQNRNGRHGYGNGQGQGQRN